jgi:hypothetical protein
MAKAMGNILTAQRLWEAQLVMAFLNNSAPVNITMS